MTAVTIYAVSSGPPPAAIAIVRVSGPAAGATLERLARRRPPPRRASLAALQDPDGGELLDQAMVLWMPGPATATGEDLAELHLHGGRAVVDGVMDVLKKQPGLREAEAGEFTRRAFENGCIDLNQAEGLADLLAAETASQRRAALLSSGGALSRQIEDWQTRLLAVAAAVEAAIDYSDEDDVGEADVEHLTGGLADLAREMQAVVARPSAERLRDGVRVVVAGPPNSGKSSLINALCGRDAAIESPLAGTTRDIIEVPLAVAGVPMILIDTAGLRDSADGIEAIGVEKAERALATADIVLWLGDDKGPPTPGVIEVHARADQRLSRFDRLNVSARTGQNLGELMTLVSDSARQLLPREGDFALNHRQLTHVRALHEAITGARQTTELLLVAEQVRSALKLCDQLTGRAGVEHMLDHLFARFCIGK